MDRGFCMREESKPTIETESDTQSEINTHRNNGIAAIASIKSSHFTPRDRDLPTDSPLEGGSVPNLAGQASAEGSERNALIIR